MYYKAENVDTDKALTAIAESRRYQEAAANLKIEKERSFLEGVHKGLDIAEEIFQCSSYEKKKRKEPGYADGVLDVLYELGKELDISTQDIRDNFSSVDDACAIIAERIREKVNS